MVGRVRQSEDYGAFVESRHTLDDFLGEGAADCANTYNRCRFDALDRGHEVPGWRVWVSVRLLKIHQVLSSRLQQPVNVEHVKSLLRLFCCQAFLDKRRAQQVGESNPCRARTQEEIFFVAQFCALDLCRIDHAGEHDACRALDVVVVAAVPVAVAFEEMDGVNASPILEVNTTPWED